MQTTKKPRKRSTRSNRYNDDRVDYNLEEEIASNSAKTWKNTFKIKNSFKLNDVHGSFVKLLELKETKMVFADGPAGTGKAQPLDADILTPAGWKKMGNIQINDLVYTANGTPTKVLNIYPQGEKDIYRVVFSDGASTECCKEHLWLTQTYYERVGSIRKYYRSSTDELIDKIIAPLPPSVRSLEEIEKTLFLGNSTNANHSIPITKPVSFKENQHIIHPYILGVLLGDGCLTQSVGVSISDTEILEKVKELLPLSVCLKYRSQYDYSIVSNEANYRDNIVLDEIRRLQLSGKHSWEKFIPQEYLIDSIENRTWLLRGLLDADGTIEKTGSVSFCSTSHKLIQDTKFIVETLGGLCKKERAYIPKFVYQGTNKHGRLAYNMYINLPNIVPFFLQRKVERLKLRTKYFPIRYIKDIQYVGKKQAQCILVEDESHLYLTNNCIVTHNTYLAVLAALELLQLKSIDNIVYIRSIVESASRSMGSLPGELQDKFMPWALPLIEKLDELVGPVSRTELLKSDVVKCLPVNFVRGLTFRNSLVIVDEAQNLTHTELVAILTRFGENTKYVVIGDTRQSDIYNKSGYLGILNLFNDEQSQDKGIHVFKFGESEIVRSKILKFIVQKLETLQPTYSESQDYRAHKQKSHSAPVVPPQMTPYGQYPEEWQVTPLCDH